MAATPMATASTAAPGGVDCRSGYSASTGTFRSLRPPVPLPPPHAPLSFPAFAASLLPSPLPPQPAFQDAATGEAVSYPAFLALARALAATPCSCSPPRGSTSPHSTSRCSRSAPWCARSNRR